MVTRILQAAGIFVVFLFFKGYIDQHFVLFWKYMAYLAGIGLPIARIGDPICSFIYSWMRTRIITNETRRAFKLRMEQMSQASAYRNPYQEQEGTQETVDSVPKAETPKFTTAQIEQLNRLRRSITSSEAQRFPGITLVGQEMTNLVPQAGLFTVRLRKRGQTEIKEAVAMFATEDAVKRFEAAYAALGNMGYTAQGYLLPSRTGMFYSVFYVTAFSLGGRIVFG